MKEYQALFKLFEGHLEKYIGQLQNLQPQSLYSPEAYILALGGKRVRPLLALIACDLFESDPKKALDAALAVELFHNFSLIHDDILDQAPLRRGKETVHIKWNTNVAILSGDVMLVKALQILQSYPAQEYQLQSRVFQETAIAVCEGQQLDMDFETKDLVSVEEYLEMIRKKTAVLLGCSLQMGAISAGAIISEQNNLYEFGMQLGLAFQLLDDYLDAFAKTHHDFGKQIGGDILANKKTFLTLKALELADATQKKRLELIFSNTTAELKISQMLEIYAELGVAEICTAAADAYTQKAIAALDRLSVDPKKKSQLKSFAAQLLNRQN